MTDQPTPAAPPVAAPRPASALDPLGRRDRIGDAAAAKSPPVLRWRQPAPVGASTPAPAAPPPPADPASDTGNTGTCPPPPRRPRLGLRWPRADSAPLRGSRWRVQA